MIEDDVIEVDFTKSGEVISILNASSNGCGTDNLNTHNSEGIFIIIKGNDSEDLKKILNFELDFK